jgi:hypothetical protein
MADKIEHYARLFRYPFIGLAILVFIVNYYRYFDSWLMWIFVLSGLIWLVTAAYIDVRETTRHYRKMILDQKDQSFVKKSVEKHYIGGKMKLNMYRISAVCITLGCALVLFFWESRPDWIFVLVVIGPAATWITQEIEKRSQGNKELIHSLKQIISDVKILEYSTRRRALDLLSVNQIQTQLDSKAIIAWNSFYNLMGDMQLPAISSLDNELKKIDITNNKEVNNVVKELNRVLVYIIEAERKYIMQICQSLKTIPEEQINAWEYVRQIHQRIVTQLLTLKPVLDTLGQKDIFNGFLEYLP